MSRDLYRIWHTIKHICGQNNAMLTRIVVLYMQSLGTCRCDCMEFHGRTICYLATIANY